jgi:hypothetical protein
MCLDPTVIDGNDFLTGLDTEHVARGETATDTITAAAAAELPPLRRRLPNQV